MGKQFFLWLVPSSRYLSSRRLVRLDVWRGTGGRLVDPQFHICALADLWEYSPVYCECDMTVIQIPNRERWRVLDPRCLEARREGDSAMLEEEPRLRSRGRSGSDLLVPTPDPRWSRSGRCVHTWRITHSNHGTQMRWSPNAKLETNVWWFSLAAE